MSLNDMSSQTGRIIKEDGTTINHGDVLELLQNVEKAIRPLKTSATVSIAAAGSGTAMINVEAGYVYQIKKWTVTKGADVTVIVIKVDGFDTYQLDSLADTETEYGKMLTATSTVEISGSNAGAAAEDLTIEIVGVKIPL